MRLLDPAGVRRLQLEFRRSMRSLLTAVCLDIQRHYAPLAKRLMLPAEFFRFLSVTVDRSSYSNWKMVGWIEALNDLL